ncbi:hypothetical protein PLESTB_001248900 [Pleodorina starrii]|uniref:Uncharacterized protein n=1 Tax=Pleodorina starrii TaxID=330485 RepID=A0A9W6BTF4_9CHLO|nr:hypothetical protein PLESTM_000211100 [Pleodorina starrii]GLC57640.1 hypothetical protein PLESTB_001248900 [Pleodorina starrii]GLC63310.1 hypothetical protein PLESTF_000022700 [Pleodorina starrii]
MVQELAAKKLKLDESEVDILGVERKDGESLDMESALKKTVNELADKEAVVRVALPESAESQNDCEIQTLEEQVEILEEKLGTLRTAIALQQKVALRKLLDDVRSELIGRKLTKEECGEAWNSRLQEMEDFKGLKREAAMLTQFGHGTQQWHISKAAHQVDVPVIAHAVTAAPKKHAALYRELFQFAYNLDADQVVFEVLDEDE